MGERFTLVTTSNDKTPHYERVNTNVEEFGPRVVLEFWRQNSPYPEES